MYPCYKYDVEVDHRVGLKKTAEKKLSDVKSFTLLNTETKVKLFRETNKILEINDDIHIKVWHFEPRVSKSTGTWESSVHSPYHMHQKLYILTL